MYSRCKSIFTGGLVDAGFADLLAEVASRQTTATLDF
jgi:hypothetical protein